MEQKFEIIISDIDDTIPWTEAQLKETIECMMNGETIQVKEIKDTK